MASFAVQPAGSHPHLAGDFAFDMPRTRIAVTWQ